MVRNMKKVIVFLVLLLSFQQIWARPLKLREGKVFRKSLVIMASLQRGAVPGSGPNPCSTVPGRSHGRCNAEVNVVARRVASYAPPPPPPPFQNMVDKFGAAASINASETQKQGSSPP